MTNLTLLLHHISIHARALGSLDHAQDILRLAFVYDSAFGRLCKFFRHHHLYFLVIGCYTEVVSPPST